MQSGQKRIQKYQFSMKNAIGSGSYATVYKGKIVGTQEEVAIKVIDKKLFVNAYNLKNIQSEVEIMKQVNHQNIVKLFDIYQTSNNMYIITEYCDGGDLLGQLRKRNKLPQNQAKKFLKDIMKGAKYLHSKGIIHRDLKPANILIKDGVCKISDFGFAKSLEEQNSIMKSIVGTPLYMSPQLLKRLRYTNKSDLWSIGLIYYEMLHGRTPWPAKNQLQLVNGIYAKPINFSKEVSEQSKDFIKKCLKIHQEDRISWEEAFQHRLIKDYNIKKLTLDDIGKSDEKQQEVDKENNLNRHNLSNISLRLRKDLSEIKLKRVQALTPKGSKTPVGRQTKLRNILAVTPNKQRSVTNRRRFARDVSATKLK